MSLDITDTERLHLFLFCRNLICTNLAEQRQVDRIFNEFNLTEIELDIYIDKDSVISKTKIPYDATIRNISPTMASVEYLIKATDGDLLKHYKQGIPASMSRPLLPLIEKLHVFKNKSI